MEPFIGEIRLFAGNYAPQGWLLCQGQLIDISSNEILYALLG
ncbi:phage tail protein, partial [Ralstonia pseudosolanacearum]